MASRAEILNLGTQAGRFFLRKRSKASSRLAQKPSWTSARAHMRTARRMAIGQGKNRLGLQRECPGG